MHIGILNETIIDQFDDTDLIYLKYAKMINSDNLNKNEFIKYCESFLYSGYDIDLLFATNLTLLPTRNVKLCELLWRCYNIAIKRNVFKKNYKLFIYHENENQCRIKFTMSICETALKILYPNDVTKTIGGKDVLSNKDSYHKFINQVYDIFFIHMKSIEQHLLDLLIEFNEKQKQKKLTALIH